MSIQIITVNDLWNLLIAGRSMPQIECWWFQHNEESQALVIHNQRKQGILNVKLTFYCLSGRKYEIILPKLKGQWQEKIVLSNLPDWSEKPGEKCIALISLQFASNTFFYRNLNSKVKFCNKPHGKLISDLQYFAKK